MNLDELKEMQDEKKKVDNPPVTSLKELKQLLKNVGQEWREEHTTVNEKTGKVKIPSVSPRAVADILKKHCHFILIDEDNPELSPLAVYDLDSGIYQKGERFINRLSMSVERTLSEPQCNNIRHFLTMESQEKTRTINRDLIVVNNGVYNRNKGVLEPFTSDYVFVNKIRTNYVENAKEPIFKDWKLSKWINELSDDNASKEKLLWQMFAVAINSNYISEVAVFLLSEQGRTGKSTYQQLLINLVGKENATSLKIKDFENDFKLASAYGKSLVIGDDNNPHDFRDTSENFKSVTTGDSVLLNPKGKDVFSTVLTPFVVQSLNGMPSFRDISDGLQRRLRIVRFNHSYKGDNNNRDIKEKYIYDDRLLEFILSKAIKLEFSEVEDTAESKQAIHELVLENSSITAFYEDVFQQLESDRLPMKFLFKYFQAWSDYENQPTKIKQNTFTKELKQLIDNTNWMYEPKNFAPLNLFYQTDMKRLNELDIHYKYRFDVKEKQKQPLLKRKDD